MLLFPPIEESDASDEVVRIYHEYQRTFGFPEVPNFIRMQGGSPSVLAGTWGLVQNVLGRGRLPRTVKELIWVAIAVDRECVYCEHAHIACCRILGVDERTIRALREGLKEDLPEDLRDIIGFATHCAAAPHELCAEDFDRLRRHGLSTQEILEVIATASAAVYAIIIADATKLETDAMFNGGEI